VETMTGTARARASAPIWGALLLSAGSWSLHLTASHFVVEAACGPLLADSAGDANGGVLAGAASAGWLVLALGLLTVAAAIVALLGLFYAWARRRSLERRGPGLERAAGLSTVVVSLAGFFVLLIVLQAFPLLLIGCGAP
jgi:hypothetical protein